MVDVINKAKAEPLIYGFALFRYTQVNERIESGPTGSNVLDTLKDEVGSMVMENLIGQTTDVLTEVIPFAGSAIKILRMILG